MQEFYGNMKDNSVCVFGGNMDDPYLFIKTRDNPPIGDHLIVVDEKQAKWLVRQLKQWLKDVKDFKEA